MNCNRLVYYHRSSKYTHIPSFDAGLKTVYIPQGDSYVPCLYYLNPKSPYGKLVLFFHGVFEDLGSEVL